MRELGKIYDPSSVEDKHYKKWVDAGYFHAERDPDKRPYTIVMPPPNITGQLHMGHAMDETWQDILIRYKRMQGYAALWVPGTDHASIATEAKIVAKMKEEGLTKQESNIGLMVAVNEFEPDIDRDFQVFCEKMIRKHLEETLEEYNASTRSAVKMANRVNEMNDIATAFAREYEREAKPSEIAERMGITEEEVRELMKVSLDAIAVLDQSK